MRLPPFPFPKPTDARRWGFVERGFLSLYVVSSVISLVRQWGQLQGFDAGQYLDMIRIVRWFEPLPDVRASFESYHPPLYSLLTNLLTPLYPHHEIECSQLVSWLAVVLGFFCLRAALRKMGLLRSIFGILFLYFASSIPLFIFLQTETSLDPLTFFWAALTFYSSVLLFWERDTRVHPFRWHHQSVGFLLLILAMTGGLLTKFTGVLNFATPFIVIAVRHRWQKLTARVVLAGLACLCAAAILSPFYYHRYYLTEGKILMVNPMEWLTADALRAEGAKREANPVGYALNLLRMPEAGVLGKTAPINDSLFHSIWFQTWKRDEFLGPRPWPSSRVSDLYSVVFLSLTLAGTLCFLLDRSPRRWSHRQFGWILLFVSALAWVAILRFSFRYPVWDWRIFKAKYVAFSTLWFAFSSAYLLECIVASWLAEKRSVALPIILLTLVAIFVVVNHVVPVY